MSNNVYIGNRYVPKIMGNWNSETSYESLMVVLYEGNSYTSITNVPSGILPTNSEYWALSGNYNAQVEQYRQEVVTMKEEVNTQLKKQEENIDLIIANKQTEMELFTSQEKDEIQNVVNENISVLDNKKVEIMNIINSTEYIIDGGDFGETATNIIDGGDF